MTEKSGIDMISQLLKEVKLMNQKLNILDANVKKIMNSAKISEIATKALNTPLKDWATPNKIKRIEAVLAPETSTNIIKKENIRFNFEVTDAAKLKRESPNRSSRPEAPTLCMCNGKMVISVGSKNAPLPNLDVKIYNDKDELIKETKTNRAGNWMSQLPVGRYVANIEGKLKGKQLYPVNLNFEVKHGMKKLEVK